jgi:hypothetical protein
LDISSPTKRCGKTQLLGTAALLAPIVSGSNPSMTVKVTHQLNFFFIPPEAEYRFKHALIQDAAYENLLKSRRQAFAPPHG